MSQNCAISPNEAVRRDQRVRVRDVDEEGRGRALGHAGEVEVRQAEEVGRRGAGGWTAGDGLAPAGAAEGPYWAPGPARSLPATLLKA